MDVKKLAPFTKFQASPINQQKKPKSIKLMH